MAGPKPLYTTLATATDDGLVFNSFEENTGGWGYKANFAFYGYDLDMDNCFLVNATWNVSQNNAPYLQIAPADSPSSPLSGLTAKVIASEAITAYSYQGNIEIYPLPSGNYVASWIYNGGETTETISFSVGNLNKKAKELSSGTLASSISASTSTLSVYVGEGTTAEIMGVWPNTPFYASIMPATPSAGVPNNLDSEIVKVSGVSTDGNGNTTLSVVRAQKGTTAKAFSEGAIVTNASYASDALILGDDGTVEPEEPWITPDMMTGFVSYINGARGGDWGSTWNVYTDTTYTTVRSAEEIDDAVDAGVSVVFRTNDNYDLRILGRFSVDSTYKYYTAAYDGFLLGTLRLTISTGQWNWTDSQVQTADIADSAITTAKINSKAVTNAKIADNTIQNGKINWSGFFTETTGTYSKAWKFPDGKMIVFGSRSIAYNITGSYEGAYFASTGDNFSSVFNETFYATPQIVVTLEYNSGLLGFNFTGTSTTGFSGYIWKTQSKSSVTVGVHFIAIGRWKA